MSAFQNLRRLALPAYYYGTWAARRTGRFLAASVGRLPIPVLFYHRVADPADDSWTISNLDFIRQIDWLTANFEVISLSELQRRMRTGKNHRPAACITFDDGYSENCQCALPFLISRHIPFTYFVSTDFIKVAQPFPHDADRLQPPRANTVEQLRALAGAGVEIGAHTRTHANLGPITDEGILRDEILGSCDDLNQMLGIRVRYFAFPYGLHANLNRAAFLIGREAGLEGMCSAYGGYNSPGIDPFHIQRLHGDPDFLRWKNWLNFDPRLVFGVRPFEFDRVDGESS